MYVAVWVWVQMFSHPEWWIITNDRLRGHQRQTGGWVSFAFTHSSLCLHQHPANLSVHTSLLWLTSFFSYSCSCSCHLNNRKKEWNTQTEQILYLETRMCSTANNYLNTNWQLIVFSMVLWHYYSSCCNKWGQQRAGEVLDGRKPPF